MTLPFHPCPKPEKTGPKPRKPLSRKVRVKPRSEKRAAYMASPERRDGLRYMGYVKDLPCLCCGTRTRVEAHHCRHDGWPRNDFDTIPLCRWCHTEGPQSRHRASKTWRAKWGADHTHIKATRHAVAALEDDLGKDIL